jgi:hypothetical protein
VLRGGGAFCFGLESVAPTVDGNDLGMMKQAIKDGAGGRNVVEEFAPFFDRPIGSHHGGTVFVTAHNDLQEDFTAFLRQDFEAHIVDKCGAPHLLINVEFPKMWSCTVGC